MSRKLSGYTHWFQNLLALLIHETYNNLISWKLHKYGCFLLFISITSFVRESSPLLEPTLLCSCFFSKTNLTFFYISLRTFFERSLILLFNILYCLMVYSRHLCESQYILMLFSTPIFLRVSISLIHRMHTHSRIYNPQLSEGLKTY